MMKHFTLYVLATLFTCSISCKKIGKLKEFDLHYSNEVTILSSSSIIAIPIDIQTPETTTNTEGEYKNEGTNSKLIERVTLKELKLTVKAPQSGNFDFLNSIEIYLSSPTQSEVLIASKNDIPETGLTNLNLDVYSTDLKGYLQDKSFNLRFKIKTDRTIPYDMTILCNETFHVKARLRNIFKA